MSLRGDAALSAVTALTYMAFSTTNPLELVFEPAAPGELDDINMLARGLIVLLFLLVTWPKATPLFGVPLSLAALGQRELELTAVASVIAIVLVRRFFISISAPRKSSADLGIAGAAAPDTPAKLVSPAMVAATSSPQLVLKSMKEAQQLREQQQREAALKQQEQQVKLQQQQQQQQQQHRANQTPVKAATVAQAPAQVRTPVAGKTPGAAKTPSVHSPQVVLDAQAKAAADMKRRLDERLVALKKPKGPAPR